MKWLLTLLVLLLMTACGGRTESPDVDVVDAPQGEIAEDGCLAPLFLDVEANPANQNLPEPELTVACEGAFVVVISNSVPNHAAGNFPNAAVAELERSYQFPLDPVMAAEPISLTINDGFGVTLNGLLLDPLAAEYWNNDPESGWNYDSLALGLGIDENNAHVQPDGSYHYHSIPTALIDLLDSNEAQVLIGFAADGYPIYVNGEGGAQASSYLVRSGERPDGPGGAYDGTYVEDYEYVDGAGTLDACNGTTGSTPEFPDGIYHYYVTEAFPNIPRCFAGEVPRPFAKAQVGSIQGAPPDGGGGQDGPPDDGGGQGGPPEGGGGQGGPPEGAPDLAVAAEILGVPLEDLRMALGPPPPDLAAASEILGVSEEELREALEAARP